MDDATTRVTTGISHVAVIVLTEWSWRVILYKESGMDPRNYRLNRSNSTCEP